jgi:hypothetical protein
VSIDYYLAGRFPSADPRRDALEQVARALGLGLAPESDGRPRIRTEGLVIDAFEPDAEDRKFNDQIFGFEQDVDLAFTCFDAPGNDLVTALRQVMTATACFTAVPGFHGVLFDECSQGGYMALISQAALVLNSDYWAGRPGIDDILAGLPQRPTMTALRVHEEFR